MLFTARHLYKLFVGRLHTSLLLIPLKYANPGIFVPSIMIAQSVPNIPAIINAVINKIFVEQPFEVLQKISPTIKMGKIINVGMFCEAKLFVEIKYVK